MAFLPLAGWAADLQPSDVVVGSPYYGNMPTYSGPAVTAASYIVDGYYDNSACTGTPLTDDEVKETNAGTTLYVRISGTNLYEGTITKSFQIKVMPLVLTGTAGTKPYGTSGAETIFTIGTSANSVKTKYNVGVAPLDLTTALRTQFDFTRDLGPNVGAYAISGAFKSATAAAYKNNYSIASADITTNGTTQAKYTITQRNFISGDGVGATVNINVTANLTYNASAQEATVTVADKIAGLNPLTRGYVYETVAEYNAAHPTAPVADLTELNGKTIAERTKTPGDYFLVWADNTNAGTATVTVKGMGNYAEGTEGAVNFTINRAPLFVTPSAEKVYDATTNIPDLPTEAATAGPNPTAFKDGQLIYNDNVTFTFQGFVDASDAEDITINVDGAGKEAPVLAWKGTATPNVGENYAIEFSNADITKCFAATNYTFIALEGTFTITQKNVTAKANNAELDYGDPEVFALKEVPTTSLSEAKALSDADVTALTDAIKIVKGAQIPAGQPNAGKYPLTPSYKSDAEIDADADKAIENRVNAAVDANATIDPEDKPAAKVAGLAAAKAAAKVAIANYTLNAGDGQAAASVGLLTINQAPLYIGLKETAYTLNKVYDGQAVAVDLNKTTGLTIIGAKGTDVINVNNLTLDVEDNDVNVGLYTLRLSGADIDNPNYAITYIPSQYEIKQKELKITVFDQVFVTSSTTAAALNKNLYQIDATKGLASTDKADEVFKLDFVAGVKSAMTSGKFIDVPADGAGWLHGVFANGIDAVASNADPTKTKWANYDVDITQGDVTVIAAAGTITLDDTKDMKATLVAQNGHVNNVTFTASRNLTANSWNVMVLPFDITVSDLSRALGYAVIDVMDEDATDGNVHFNIYMGTIKANTPFMFKVDGQYQNLNQVVFAGKTIVYDTTNPAGKVAIDADGNSYVTDKGGNKLIGVYKNGTAIADGWYYFGKDKTTQLPSWVPASNAQPSKGERALLVLNNTSAARIFVEEPNGTVTEIETINADGVAVAKDGWFTLNGVKLQGMPTEKGIYINNGKKVVVK